jgi:hypothetical protein
MELLTNEQIKEIAEQLDCGFRCFWNRKTGELIFIPNTERHPDMDIEAWSDELELLDSDFDDYQEIDQLEPSDSFKIMEDFVYTLDDSNKLKSSLIEALNKRKPFKEFKFVIDNSGKYRQMWFDFKNQELQKWVQNKLKK